MFFQHFGGTSVGTVIVSGIACAMLALARVVRNLPKDSITKFFEHRTTKYEIIARDTKGRVATVQKQRLVFLAFVCVCVAVVVLVLVSTSADEAHAPVTPPAAATTKAPPVAS